jgi:DNA replication protein DnaC
MTSTTTSSSGRVSAPATATTPEQAATAEQVEALTRRLRLPYLRAAAADTLATARAQRWDPAEVLRVVLAAEADGRHTATIRNRRRRAGFPSGKTFHAWDPSASSIPPGAQQGLRTLEWVARRENLCLAGPSSRG